MTRDERERAVEDLLARRFEVWRLTTKLIEALHYSDFEDEREALEVEAKYFLWKVQELKPPTRQMRAEAWADDRVTEMRECQS